MDSIYLTLMSEMSPLEIITLGHCDRHLRNLSIDEGLWKSLTLQHYPSSRKQDHPALSWKQYYLELYLFSQVSCMILIVRDKVFPSLENYNRFFFDQTPFTLRKIEEEKEDADTYRSDFVVKSKRCLIKQDFINMYEAWTKHMQNLGYENFSYLVVYSE